MKKLFLMVSTVMLSLGFASCGGDESNETYDENEYQNSVDMGTSVRWYKYNLGATTETEPGDYFQWSITAPSDYHGSVNMINRYSEDGTLSAQYDAASVILEKGWRMPTPEEMQSLENACDVEFTSENGVNGLEFKSKTTGNTLFFPAAGYMTKTLFTEKEMKNEGVAGYYWTSYYSKEDGKAKRYEFSASSNGLKNASVMDGCFIRPVKLKGE